MKNCKICGQITNETNAICKECFMTYFPLLKKFVDTHSGITYMEAVFHKELPVPRNVLYEFTEAKLIKVKE